MFVYGIVGYILGIITIPTVNKTIAWWRNKTTLYGDYIRHQHSCKPKGKKWDYATYDEFLIIFNHYHDKIEFHQYDETWYKKDRTLHSINDFYVHRYSIMFNDKYMCLKSFSEYKKFRKYFHNVAEKITRTKGLFNEELKSSSFNDQLEKVINDG